MSTNMNNPDDSVLDNFGKEIPITVQTPYFTGINYLDKDGSVSVLNFDTELSRLHEMEKSITNLSCLVKSLSNKVSIQSIALGMLSAIIVCTVVVSLVVKFLFN